MHSGASLSSRVREHTLVWALTKRELGT